MLNKEIIKLITDKYSSDDILESIDESMINYIEPNWQDDGYESEYDWYCDHCTDEAESEVLQSVIHEVTTDLSMQDYSLIYDELKEVWDLP